MSDIRIDMRGADARAIGGDHGITPGELREIVTQVKHGHSKLVDDRKKKRYGFYDLYSDAKTLADVEKTAKQFRAKGFENLVVLGIGGSALGITALTTALKPPYYNLLSAEQREGSPRLFVMDNVDPETFDQMLAICPPEKTLYNVISKSGSTAETVAQMAIVFKALEKAVGAARLKHHVIITTGPGKRGESPTSLLAAKKEYGLKGFDVPVNVGGRFSVFTPVGLFPAAMIGMDLKGFVDGCKRMDKRCKSLPFEKNPAYLRAVYHFLAWSQKGKSISVMLPYADSLRDVADWYRQIWAESLGKKMSLDGDTNYFAGQTPVKALGVTDQHSQLQLYLEGPNDKIITVLEPAAFRKTLRIPDMPSSITTPSYLKKATMNKLIAAERKATVDALREAHRPVVRVILPTVNESTVAQTLYMLEVETALAGRLFNVDAFDQPAVERIKVLTRKYMGGGA